MTQWQLSNNKPTNDTRRALRGSVVKRAMFLINNVRIRHFRGLGGD